MTLDIAGGAGIRVAPPGASDAVAGFDDHQAVAAGAAPRHRRTKTAESRTDDRRLRRASMPGRCPTPAEDIPHGPTPPPRISSPSKSPLARHLSRMSAYSVGPPKKNLPCRFLASAFPSRL